jgi:hypothetical protein
MNYQTYDTELIMKEEKDKHYCNAICIIKYGTIIGCVPKMNILFVNKNNIKRNTIYNCQYDISS